MEAGESPRALQKSIVTALLSPEAVEARPDIVERALSMGDGMGQETLRAQLRMQATRVDLRPGLREVNVPTLVVSGAADSICLPEFHTEIAGEVPNARVISLAGGHLLPLEQPATFGVLVRAWRERWL